MELEVFEEISAQADEPKRQNPGDKDKGEAGKAHDLLEDEAVAKAASGLNGVVVVGGGLAKFCPQGLDVGVDGAVHGGAGVFPSLHQDLVAGEGAAGLGEKESEDFVFVGGEVERLPEAVDGHCGFIMVEKAGGFFGSLEWAGAGAPENGADASDHRAGGEGLGDVVVGSELETEDLVDFGIAGGEEEDGHLRKFAHLATDIEAENVGKADVEDEKVAVVLLQPLDAVESGLGIVSVEAFGAQGIEDGVRDGGLVFDEQNGGHGERVENPEWRGQTLLGHNRPGEEWTAELARRAKLSR